MFEMTIPESVVCIAELAVARTESAAAAAALLLPTQQYKTPSSYTLSNLPTHYLHVNGCFKVNLVQLVLHQFSSSSFLEQNLLSILLLYYYVDVFNGLRSRTTWVSQHQKGKPFGILLEQEMMGWQWHQLDHMQIVCISLQTDNHSSTSPLSFYWPDALPAA